MLATGCLSSFANKIPDVLCLFVFFFINQKVFRIILLVLKQLNPQRREITLVLRALQFHVVLDKDGHEGQK